MRSFLPFPFILAWAVATLSAQSSKPEALAAMEKNWSAAYLRHDVGAIERLLADEFTGIDGRGVMSNKQDELAEAKAPMPGASPPPFVIIDEAISDIRVRLYGKTAVLTSLNLEKIRSNAGESTVRYRRTTVWIRRQARWQCVSFHASRTVAK